jgi:hypothetical protein
MLVAARAFSFLGGPTGTLSVSGMGGPEGEIAGAISDCTSIGLVRRAGFFIRASELPKDKPELGLLEANSCRTERFREWQTSIR